MKNIPYLLLCLPRSVSFFGGSRRQYLRWDASEAEAPIMQNDGPI